MTLGSHSYLTENRAGGNNQGGRGGAIDASSDLTLKGNTFFEGNLVSGGGSNSLGGAIYLNGDIASTATLDTGTGADTGAIAFSGNKINVDTPGGVVDDSSGDANSIHLTRNTRLDITGNNNVYFDDPISSGANGNNSLTKTGTGFVQFVGNNRLNTTGGTGNTVDITGGTFRVVNNGITESFNATGAGNFNVGANGTLAGQGTITANAFTISGTLSADSDRFEIPKWTGDLADGTRINAFDAGKTTLDPSKKIGTLNLSGDVEFTSGATLAVDLADAGNDLIAVTGNVTGSGGKIVADVAGLSLNTIINDPTKEFTILTATGTLADNIFNTIVDVSSTWFAAMLGYDADARYYLTLSLVDSDPLARFATTHNRRQIVNAVYDLTGLGTKTDAEWDAFIDGINGTQLVADAQMMALWQPWRKAFNQLYNYDTTGRGYLGQTRNHSARNAWFDGYYRNVNAQSDGNADSYDEHRGGVMVGIDQQLDGRNLFGVTFGYGNPIAKNRHGRIEADDYTFGLYGKSRIAQCLWMNTYLGFGLQEYESRRDVYSADYSGLPFFVTFFRYLFSLPFFVTFFRIACSGNFSRPNNPYDRFS